MTSNSDAPPAVLVSLAENLARHIAGAPWRLGMD